MTFMDAIKHVKQGYTATIYHGGGVVGEMLGAGPKFDLILFFRITSATQLKGQYLKVARHHADRIVFTVEEFESTEWRISQCKGNGSLSGGR